MVLNPSPPPLRVSHHKRTKYTYTPIARNSRCSAHRAALSLPQLSHHKRPNETYTPRLTLLVHATLAAQLGQAQALSRNSCNSQMTKETYIPSPKGKHPNKRAPYCATTTLAQLLQLSNDNRDIHSFPKRRKRQQKSSILRHSNFCASLCATLATLYFCGAI